MKIDTTTEFGQRVTRRLQEELIIWMTTVDSQGLPQPRPVWFTWDDETMLIYSHPDAFKVSHIATNPQVALNFDSDGQGGDIVVFIGEAWVDENAPPPHQDPVYLSKYKDGMAGINMTPDQYASAFSLALRVKLLKLRGH